MTQYCLQRIRQSHVIYTVKYVWETGRAVPGWLAATVGFWGKNPCSRFVKVQAGRGGNHPTFALLAPELASLNFFLHLRFTGTTIQLPCSWTHLNHLLLHSTLFRPLLSHNFFFKSFGYLESPRLLAIKHLFLAWTYPAEPSFLTHNLSDLVCSPSILVGLLLSFESLSLASRVWSISISLWSELL